MNAETRSRSSCANCQQWAPSIASSERGGRQLVQRLVQIHDKDMEGVFLAAPAAGQSTQMCRVERAA
jgi:hypothetical protein